MELFGGLKKKTSRVLSKAIGADSNGFEPPSSANERNGSADRPASHLGVSNNGPPLARPTLASRNSNMSITVPVNLIPRLVPDDDDDDINTGDAVENERSERSDSRSESRNGRPSPDQQSIRSRTPSNLTDSRNRRSDAVSVGDDSQGAGGERRASTVSLGKQKALPRSPQDERAPSVRSERRSEMPSGRQASMSSNISGQSSRTSNYASSIASSRIDAPGFYVPAAGPSTIATPHRGSVLSVSTSTRPRTPHSIVAPNLPSCSPYAVSFDFPRPSDSIVDEMFEHVLIERGMDPGTHVDLENRWKIVHNHEAQKWKKAREELTKKPVNTRGTTGTGAGGAMEVIRTDRMSKLSAGREPGWYITKFFNGSIKPEDVAALVISLRTYDLEWVEKFIASKGQTILASALSAINRHDSMKRITDPNANALEQEILKALKNLFNGVAGAYDAVHNNTSIRAIVESLTSPSLPARSLAAHLLIFLLSRDGPNLTLRGFDAVQASRKAIGRFDVWFQYLEEALDGRGKMGSVVGASDTVMSLRGANSRTTARSIANEPLDLDKKLGEYGFLNMLLIDGFATQPADLTIRVSLRAQMESAGLHRILQKLSVLDHDQLRRKISDFKANSDSDDADIADVMKEDELMNFSGPESVLSAIVANTEGRAADFLGSTMKHLLLIPKEPEMRMRYFQLIDKLVASVVTDRKGLDGDFTSLLGSSVAALASRFGEEDRLEVALDEAAHAKAMVSRLRQERETMRQEISEKDQGLVGKLKAQLIDLENALTISRNATQTLRSQLDGYKTREEEDEILRRDLFQQLEKAGAFEFVGEGKEVLDQRELLELLSKKGHRNLTVQKLEGGRKGRGPLSLATDDVTLNRGKLFDEAAEGISHSTFSPDSDSVASPWSQRAPVSYGQRSGVHSSGSISKSRRKEIRSDEPSPTGPQPTLPSTPPHRSTVLPVPILPASKRSESPIRRTSTLSPPPSKSSLPRSPSLADQIRSRASKIGTSPRIQRDSEESDTKSTRTDSFASHSTTADSVDSAITSIESSTISFDSEFTATLSSPFDPFSSRKLSPVAPSSPPTNDFMFSRPSSRSGAVSATFDTREPFPIKKGQPQSKLRLSDSDDTPTRSNVVPPLPPLPPQPAESTTTPSISISPISDDPRPPLAPTPPPYVAGVAPDADTSAPIARPNSLAGISLPRRIGLPSSIRPVTPRSDSPPPTPSPPPPEAPPPPPFVAGPRIGIPAAAENEPPQMSLKNLFASRAAARPPPLMSMSEILNGRSTLKSNTSPSNSSTGSGRPSLGSSPTPSVVPRVTYKGPLRKGITDVAGVTMKQFQWDKLNSNGIASTVFAGDHQEEESEWARKLRMEGMFDDMEQEFRAKQTVQISAKRVKKTLDTVLKPEQRQRIEISLLKPGSANEGNAGKIDAIALKILRFDDDLSETFLSELKQSLPDAEQEGKLNMYRSAPIEDLDNLHTADRFLVECLKIHRLRPRVDGMLYRARFEESIVMLEEDARKVLEASTALLNAPHFADLLKLILLLGNYMNGAGHKGGAYGFKVTSINKLVDTKSANGSDHTLLHFLAKTVAKYKADEKVGAEAFLDELVKPADAHKSDLSHVRTVLSDLRTQQKALSTELDQHFTTADDLNPLDGFATKMFSFSKQAKYRLDILSDIVTNAGGKYSEALAFYGEEQKSITSTSEFFGVFRTFVTSYKKARDDNNRAIQMQEKARAASEKKAAAAAEAIATRAQSSALVDDVIQSLRDGASESSPRRRVGTKARSAQRSGSKLNPLNAPSSGLVSPVSERGDPTEESNGLGTEDEEMRRQTAFAQSIKARLHGDGFTSSPVTSGTTTPVSTRRMRAPREQRKPMPISIGNGFPSDSLSASPTGTIFEEVEPPLTPKVGSDSFAPTPVEKEEEKGKDGEGRGGAVGTTEESSFVTP